MFLQFLKTESYKKGIFFSTGLNIIAKLFSFLTSLVIAYYFGTQVKADVYFYCISGLTLLSALVISIDAYVLIPESMRLSHQHSAEESMAFLNFFLYLYLIIGIFLVVLLLTRPVDILLIVSKFDRLALEANFKLLVFCVPLLLLMIICSFLVDILGSFKFFTMSMIGSMLNSILSMCFLIFFNRRLGILSLVIGLLFGYLFQILFLFYMMKTLLKWDFSFKFIHIGLKNLKNIFFSLLGNISTMLSDYVPLFLLSGFGPGIIASLNYAKQISNLPTNMLTAQFSSVVAIKFNELIARKDQDKLNESFLSSMKFLSFVLIPISFIAFLYSYEIITILFKRGAFNQDSVSQSAVFLRYFSLLLPMFGVNTIVARLFMAGQKIIQGFWYQTIMNVALIILIFVGIGLFGISGYLAALLCMNILNWLFCYFLLKLFFPTVNYKDGLLHMTKLYILNGAICYAVYYLKHFISSYNMIFNLIAGSGVYLFCLFLMNAFFRFDYEIHHIFVSIKNTIIRGGLKNGYHRV